MAQGHQENLREPSGQIEKCSGADWLRGSEKIFFFKFAQWAHLGSETGSCKLRHATGSWQDRLSNTPVELRFFLVGFWIDFFWGRRAPSAEVTF